MPKYKVLRELILNRVRQDPVLLPATHYIHINQEPTGDVFELVYHGEKFYVWESKIRKLIANGWVVLVDGDCGNSTAAAGPTPKNNDGRQACYACGAPTRKAGGGAYDVCTKCGK